MRIWYVLPFIFFVELLPVRATPCWSPGPVVPDRTYSIIAADEDWSFLRDPALRKDFWDPIKYQPGVEVRWQIDRHAYLQSDYGIFFAGNFLRQTMPGSNLNYVTFFAGYRF